MAYAGFSGLHHRGDGSEELQNVPLTDFEGKTKVPGVTTNPSYYWGISASLPPTMIPSGFYNTQQVEMSYMDNVPPNWKIPTYDPVTYPGRFYVTNSKRLTYNESANTWTYLLERSPMQKLPTVRVIDGDTGKPVEGAVLDGTACSTPFTEEFCRDMAAFKLGQDGISKSNGTVSLDGVHEEALGQITLKNFKVKSVPTGYFLPGETDSITVTRAGSLNSKWKSGLTHGTSNSYDAETNQIMFRIYTDGSVQDAPGETTTSTPNTTTLVPTGPESVLPVTTAPTPAAGVGGTTGVPVAKEHTAMKPKGHGKLGLTGSGVDIGKALLAGSLAFLFGVITSRIQRKRSKR